MRGVLDGEPDREAVPAGFVTSLEPGDEGLAARAARPGEGRRGPLRPAEEARFALPWGAVVPRVFSGDSDVTTVVLLYAATPL